MSRGINGRDVEEIVESMGLQCQRVPHWSKFYSSCDPDIVMLFDPGSPFTLEKVPRPSNRMLDALIYFCAEHKRIVYRDNTKPSIRKWLMNQLDDGVECAVCFETASHESYTIGCPQCNYVVCAVCTLKIDLKPERVYHFTSNDTSWTMESKCIGCRKSWRVDLKELYFVVMDQLEKFNEEQKKMLLFLKDVDAEYQRKRDGYTQAMQRKKQINARRYRKGFRAIIQGLKSKKRWNGKEVVIVGERIVRNYVIRWPVRLLDDPSSSALLKPKNMRKMFCCRCCGTLPTKE